MSPHDEQTAAPLPHQPALDVRDVRKRFGSHRVLDGVSFTLDGGAIAVLAGTNGAGKSTLLRCLAGLAAFEGAVSVRTQRLDGSARARRLVGYVPQTVSLPDTGTVGEVIELFARLRGAEVDELDLPEGFLPPRERRLGVLSGGQRQRVVLATALLGRPRVLLLDEPAANLDEDGREALWRVLGRRARDGAAVLVASPSPSDLAGVATVLVELAHGRVAAVAPLRPLRPLPVVDRVAPHHHTPADLEELGA